MSAEFFCYDVNQKAEMQADLRSLPEGTHSAVYISKGGKFLLPVVTGPYPLHMVLRRISESVSISLRGVEDTRVPPPTVWERLIEA